MKSVKIAVLPGDGIGPEIVAEAVKVVDKVAAKFDYKIEYSHGVVGAVAIDAVGEPYPKETHEKCMASRGLCVALAFTSLHSSIGGHLGVPVGQPGQQLERQTGQEVK